MPRKNYNTDGPNAEDRAWAAFTGMMIQHIKEIQKDWKKPWFTEGALQWPRNLHGREFKVAEEHVWKRVQRYERNHVDASIREAGLHHSRMGNL